MRRLFPSVTFVPWAMGLLCCVAMWGLVPAYANAFSVSPVRFAVTMNPGETREVVLSVHNTESVSKNIHSMVDGFRTDEQTGTPIFGVSSDAKFWVVPTAKDVVLEPGVTTEIHFTISVPEGAEPGSRYLALFAEESAGAGQVGVASRVGTLLFLHVAGTVHESLTAKFFVTEKHVTIISPLQVSWLLENTGSVHVVPTGTLRVIDRRGRVVYEESAFSSDRSILAGMQRSEKRNIPVPSWQSFGPLRVVYDVHYGVTNQSLHSEVVVWFFPLQMILIFIGVVSLIVCFIWVLRRVHHRHI